MAEENKKIDGAAAFKVVCDTLDAEEFNYEKDEEKLVVFCGAKGEDIPMELVIRVDEESSLLYAFSKMPFAVAEDKRMDLILAVCMANDKLINGSFDYNISDGTIIFRIDNRLVGCDVTPEMVKYLMYTAFATVDDYNDKFFMLNKGLLTLEQYLSSDN